MITFLVETSYIVFRSQQLVVHSDSWCSFRLGERGKFYSFMKIVPSHQICSYYLIVVSAKKEFALKSGNRFRSMTGCGGRFGWRKEVVVKNVRKEKLHQNGQLSMFLSFYGKKEINLLQVYFLTTCLLYTSPSPRDLSTSRMPSSA